MKRSIQMLALVMTMPLILCAQTSPAQTSPGPSKKWKGQRPPLVKSSENWISLVEKLSRNKQPFLTIVTASRMLIFFSELEAKEAALRAVVHVMDQGFPYPTYQVFRTADITPTQDYDFVNSYYLYKAIVNRESGMEFWASNYFASIDREKFPKFAFFEVLDLYQKKKLTEAEKKLRELLAQPWEKTQLPFVKKLARTLARILFDKKEYEKAFDIYSTFLLKLNPLEPEDWLEAAWCLYHLKRYEEALGILYNLESSFRSPHVNLERYVIRALIYRDYCAVQYTDELIQSFSRDFGETISGIQRGEPLRNLPALRKIKLPQTAIYRQHAEFLAQIQFEYPRRSGLNSSEEAILKYVYETEQRLLQQRLISTENEAMDKAASLLIMMYEQLKFLRFGVVRQTFNPDVLFEEENDSLSRVQSLASDGLRIRWQQLGDFWRDERLNYRGEIKNQCSR